MGFKLEISFGNKDKRSINDPLNYQAQNPEHPSSNPNRWLLDIFNSKPTSAGVRVDPETAPAFSAVYRCVSLISSTMALLPVNIFKDEGNGRVKSYDHPIARLLKNPSDLYTSYVWKENVMQFALLWGNGFSEIIRNELYEPIGLRLLHSKDVLPYITKIDGIEYLFYQVSEHISNGGVKKRIVNALDMFHIPCLSFDGVCGKSPVTIARENIGLGLAAEKFAGDFYKNDAAYSGIYTHPSALDDEAYHRLKDSLADNSLYGQKNKILLLEGGTDYKPITMPMRDAQFIESRKFQIEEIARMYGVPLHKLANLDRSTNNNIEQQALEFISDTMLAWAIKWEQEIDRKLFTEKDKVNHYTKHDFDEIQRGDSVARSAYYRSMFAIGTMSQDDIRAKEGDNPIPGGFGQKYYIPMNMHDCSQPMPAPAEIKNPTGQQDPIPNEDEGNKDI